MEKINFEEFQEMVKENIFDYLPDSYRESKMGFEVVTKHSRSYNAMFVIKKKANTSCTVDMDEFYERFTSGEDMDSICRAIAKILRTRAPYSKNFADELLDYEKVKRRLFIRVCSQTSAGERFENIPTTIIDEFVITYNIRLRIGKGAYGSALIDNEMLKHYGVTKEQLHEDALLNSRKLFPPCFESCGDIMKRLCDDDDRFNVNLLPSCIREMLLISDEHARTGAAVLFYPKVLERISKKLDGDYFVLPYSELSVIAFASKYMSDLDEFLNFAIATYNPHQDGELLSTNLYKYYSSDKTLRVVERVM